MTGDLRVADLWRRVEASNLGKPNWRNASTNGGFRSYSGGDCRVRIDGDKLRIVLRKISIFIAWFACLFLPTVSIVAWFAIPERDERFLVAIGFPVLGGILFTPIYFLQRYHERLGDYLVIDRSTSTLALPRVNREFAFSQVVGFQWIRGRSRHDEDIDIDLNLHVNESGDMIRYHVMGNPSRSVVEQLLAFSAFSLDEIDLGRHGFRDTDRGTVIADCDAEGRGDGGAVDDSIFKSA